MKKIMILGAGIYQVPLIKTAKEMGLETIVVSIPGPYPGFRIADRICEIDTRDARAVLKAAAEAGISGICTTGTDVAVRTIGYVCGHLGLRGIGQDAASVLCDKALMKEAFLKGGVRCAPGEKCFSLAQALEAARRIGYPVVVKRVDSSGSRGISAAADEAQLKQAWLLAREKTMHDYVLVEQFLKGTEIGVDGFIRDHKVEFLAPHAKYIYRGKHSTVPVGHAFPYVCSQALLEDIRLQMQLAADASGADSCCFNADVFVHEDRAWVIEMGGRCGATCIPELVSAHYGFDYYRAMITEALGERAAFPSGGGSVPCMAKLMVSPVEGVITRIDEEGLEALRGRGIDVVIDHGVGGHVWAMSDGTDRIGSVLMRTGREEELDAALAAARRCLWIDGRNLEDIWNS